MALRCTLGGVHDRGVVRDHCNSASRKPKSLQWLVAQCLDSVRTREGGRRCGTIDPSEALQLIQRLAQIALASGQGQPAEVHRARDSEGTGEGREECE